MDHVLIKKEYPYHYNENKHKINLSDREILKKCKMVSVFTSGYVNMETILHFFYKITNEKGTKTVFTYAHIKWFYGQSERAYYLNYFIKYIYKLI